MVKKIFLWLISFFSSKVVEADQLKETLRKRDEGDEAANEVRSDIKRDGLSDRVRNNDI